MKTFILLLISSAQVQLGTPAEEIDPIVLREPLRPANGVLERSASCGENRYSATIRSTGRVGDRLASVSVNGKELSNSAKAEILSFLTVTTFISDVAIIECSRDRPGSALLGLSVIDKPWLGNKMRYLEFWVSDQGKVSNIRFN